MSDSAHETQRRTNTLPGMIFGGMVFAIMIGAGFCVPLIIGFTTSEERNPPRLSPVVKPLDREAESGDEA